MNNNEKETTKNNIQIAFARLIGPLAIMSVLDSYKTKHEEIKKILNIIINWGAKFEIEQNLDFIKSDELLNVYEKINNLNTEFLYNPKLGNESFLSDEIVIWIWQIMELRKKLIERQKNNIGNEKEIKVTGYGNEKGAKIDVYSPDSRTNPHDSIHIKVDTEKKSFETVTKIAGKKEKKPETCFVKKIGTIHNKPALS